MRKPSQKITTHFSFFGPKISSAADLCNQKILPSHSWKEKIYQAQEILPSPIDDVFHANKLVDPTTSSTNSLTIYQTLLTKKIYYHWSKRDPIGSNSTISFPKIFHQIVWCEKKTFEVRNVDASKKGRASAKIFSIGDYHRSSSSVCLTKEIYHLEAQSSSVIRWTVTYGWSLVIVDGNSQRKCTWTWCRSVALSRCAFGETQNEPWRIGR